MLAFLYCWKFAKTILICRSSDRKQFNRSEFLCADVCLFFLDTQYQSHLWCAIQYDLNVIGALYFSFWIFHVEICHWICLITRLLITLVLVSGFRYQFAGFRYQLFVMHHFFVECASTLHNMFGGGGGCTMKKVTHYKKGDALQKSGTRNPQTGTRNHKQEPLLLPSSLSTVLGTVSLQECAAVHCDLNVFGTSQPRIDVCSLNSYSQSIEPSCFMFSSRYNSFPFSHPVPVRATLTKSYLWLAIHHVRHLQTGWNTFPDPYQYITQKHLY